MKLLILSLIIQLGATQTEDLQTSSVDVPDQLPPESRAAFKPGYQKPIIGILTQETDLTVDNSKLIYLSATYVKFVEAGGARSVPIFVTGNDEYFRYIFNSVNGIIFPDGQQKLSNSLYMKAAKVFYQMAVEANENNIYFPLWGEGLGFQFLVSTSSGSMKDGRSKCPDWWREPSNVQFTPEADSSRLYGKAPKLVWNSLSNKNVAVHLSDNCITRNDFEKLNFDKDFHILTTNKKIPIVSSVEGKKFPFYGLAFQPETIYDWGNGEDQINENIVHSSEAVRVAQYLARFFVDESRMNTQHFSSESEMNRYLIEGYPPTKKGTIYYFKYN